MPFAAGSTRWGSRRASAAKDEEDNPYDASKVQQQIDNARTRLEDAGVNVKADTDKRNWFEKLTNLPEKQNWFFDALELLGRPGQAVRSGIHARDQDGSFGQGALAGFTGRDRTTGADLAEGWGVDNKVLRFLVGTGIDIAADPLTYVPGAAFAKGASLAGRGAGAAARGVYQGAEKIVPGFGRLSEDYIRPAAQRTKDGFGYIFNKDYKLDETLDGGTDDTVRRLARETENTRRYLNEESLKNVTSSARAAGGLDTGTDVGRIMEAPLRQFDEVTGYEFPDGLRRTEDKTELTDAIAGSRADIKRIGKEARQKSREYDQAIGEFSKGLDTTNAEMKRLFLQLEREARKSLDTGVARNLTDAEKELRRLDNQIENFDNVQKGLLQHFKKQAAASHAMNFDLLKDVKRVAPNGIKGIAKSELPKGLLVRHEGKAIDEVANELGYQYADDLVQDLKGLIGVPRKLDSGTLERFARDEMKRTGALDALSLELQGMIKARDLIRSSAQEIRKGAVANAGKAEEQAFAAIEDHPRYQELVQQRDALKTQFDSLKGESRAVRDQKIADIQAKEDEIQALRESLRNPVAIQREIERPVRELSEDADVKAAARRLITSNDDLRQYARDNGIHIDELEGYMKHVLSKAERDARARGKASAIDQGSRGQGNPNKSILKQRELTGSAEDVNERLEREFFEPNAYFASAIGQKQLIDYVQAVQFRRKVLSNPNFARPYEKGDILGPNHVVIDTNNYKFIKEGEGVPGESLVDEIGGEYVVTKAVKNALDRYQRMTTDDGTRSVLKAYDTVLSNWKKLALLSPLYHVRNMAGAMFQNYVGGMNTPNLVKYTSSAFKDVTDAMRGKESEIFNEFRRQGLGAESLSSIEFLNASDPEEQIRKMVKRQSKTGAAKAASKLNLTQTSRETGEFFDQVNRFALYKWARDKGRTPEQAAAKVREVQFDYSDISNAERNVATRLIPFYRWMRFNIPFQLKQLASDPRKYANMNKIRLNAQTASGLEEENMPEFMKENFAVPVYGNDEGKGQYLGLNLPLADLTKVSDPLKLVIDALASPLKLPLELGLNRDFFRDKPIQKFEGEQTNYDLPGSALDFGVNPKLAYLVEQLGGQPLRYASRLTKDQEDVDQATKFSQASMGIASPLKPFDSTKDQYYNLLEELQKLQDYMKYIEQQTGQPVRTLNEIKRGSA